MPDIVPIDVWGGTRNGWPQMTLPADGIWVHHSVTMASPYPFDDFQAIDRIGLSQGHDGISYSFVIHPDGTIGEGQGTARGAHTGGNGCGGSGYGWNPCTFGVCFVGNYMDDIPTDAAIRSFQWLHQHLLNLGLLKQSAIGGHRDAPGNSTACPGNHLEDILPQLREPYTPTPGDDTVKMYALKQPNSDVVWLVWGCYKTKIKNMDALNGMLFLGIVPPVSDGNAQFLDALYEWTPGLAGGPVAPVDVQAVAKAVNDDAARRMAG